MSTAAAEIEDGLGTLAGTGKLLRFQARRTRVFLIGWFAGLAGGTWMIAAAFPGLYPTAADRAQYATTVDTPAMRSMTGPVEYIEAYADSTAAMLAHNMLLWTGALTAVMFALLVTRVTRADEETSRLEVIRSLPVGRRADLAAAMLLAVIASLVLGLLLALTVLGVPGADLEGALLYGLAHAAIGIVFAALTAVAAQIAGFGSTATGMAFGVIGLAALMSGVGSAQESGAIWASPIGWSQETFVFTAGQRWWPLAVSAGAAALLAWLAFSLVTRRDFGQGMMPARAGRAHAGGGLRSVGSLTLRLNRAVLWSGVVTMLLLGAAYGSVVGSADDMLETLSDTQRQVLDQGGASIEQNFAATISALDGLFASIFGLLVVGRARREETGGRGELLAAGPVPRSGWPGSYLPTALATVTLAVAVGGLFLAITGSASTGDGAFFGELLGASLLQLPAAWALTAFAFAAYAWLPRAGWLRWLAWVYAFVVSYFGQLLDMPAWSRALSPFDHLARYPAEDVEWLPVVLLTLVAGVFAVLGYAGARRRDLHFS
ncbi:ABC transporter permease [Glycomyces albidus]|uniref:ABC transporter permease n=1 Tax=Glycomyces albidus TaxID=2656774 RepID=A0A6L5G6Y0_9ACTN|nr:ABC transporter permease [Glycomyces albidus]MQM25386.1 ABC transporter permease [Glycomyces albidus]